MPAAKHPKTDFIVVGGSIAGMRAAVQLAQAGEVVVLTKGALAESGAHYAQAGIAAALGEDDEVALHFHDTLLAGDGLCREEAVRILVEEGPRQIQELIEWGIRFDRAGTKLAFALENAHSRSRVLRAQGDSTGAEVLRELKAKARSLRSLHLWPHSFPVDLLVEDGTASGVMCLDEKTMTFKRIGARSVLLATGGLGRVYRDTTNPPGSCGDGVAMAYRAGAFLSDLEFVQFQPTVLRGDCDTPCLMPEALRATGAHLRNVELERFMPRYHEAGELAPRETVARAIVMEMTRCRSECVYLDLTRLDPEQVRERFPKVYEACLKRNVDITADLVPVRPAAHFAVGGIATDLHGASTLKGLYAAGEVAATGVHGANYVAGNSLLEELVYGTRAAAAMIEEHPPFVPPASARRAAAPKLAPGGRPNRQGSKPGVGRDPVRETQALMSEKAGIIRDGRELADAIRRLDSIEIAESNQHSRAHYEHRNILEVSRLIACSGLAREETRGAHYRRDFPLRDDTKPPKHSFVSKDQPAYLA